MTPGELVLVYLGVAALGMAVVIVIGWRGWVSPSRLAAGCVVLAVLAIAVLLAVYRDDGCDDYTPCRVFAEPFFLMLIAFLPGALLGLWGLWALEARRGRDNLGAGD
jgi:peptidoglycan/LPS O-acetylase OafA/YrhL